MIISKNVSIKQTIVSSFHNIVWLTLFTVGVALLYKYEILSVNIPWLPISVIGTAVSFYLGFKNNQAYDRMWEARKIWGGIVNESRTWGMMVDGFIRNFNKNKTFTDEEIYAVKKRLIYRHISWLYIHRSQLLIPCPWEHISQKGRTGKIAEYYQNSFGVGLVQEDITKINHDELLAPEEQKRLMSSKNPAIQIINEQSKDLANICEMGLLEDFRHMELVAILRSFYENQGKNERIKKFPIPRVYATLSYIFVGIFIFLLPFSMIPELIKVTSYGIWFAVPLTILIGWVYIMMEVVGDYSENPFQGMANDIPMLSLCRTIEIDLREMLGEKNLPEPIKTKGNVLM